MITKVKQGGILRPENAGVRVTVVPGPVNRDVDPVRAPFLAAMHGISCSPLGPEPREVGERVYRLPTGKRGRMLRKRERSIPGVTPVAPAQRIGRTLVVRY
jgi:hypothetical protein